MRRCFLMFFLTLGSLLNTANAADFDWLEMWGNWDKIANTKQNMERYKLQYAIRKGLSRNILPELEKIIHPERDLFIAYILYTNPERPEDKDKADVMIRKASSNNASDDKDLKTWINKAKPESHDALLRKIIANIVEDESNYSLIFSQKATRLLLPCSILKKNKEDIVKAFVTEELPAKLHGRAVFDCPISGLMSQPDYAKLVRESRYWDPIRIYTGISLPATFYDPSYLSGFKNPTAVMVLEEDMQGMFPKIKGKEEEEIYTKSYQDNTLAFDAVNELKDYYKGKGFSDDNAFLLAKYMIRESLPKLVDGIRFDYNEINEKRKEITAERKEFEKLEMNEISVSSQKEREKKTLELLKTQTKLKKKEIDPVENDLKQSLYAMMEKPDDVEKILRDDIRNNPNADNRHFNYERWPTVKSQTYLALLLAISKPLSEERNKEIHTLIDQAAEKLKIDEKEFRNDDAVFDSEKQVYVAESSEEADEGKYYPDSYFTGGKEDALLEEIERRKELEKEVKTEDEKEAEERKAREIQHKIEQKILYDITELMAHLPDVTIPCKLAAAHPELIAATAVRYGGGSDNFLPSIDCSITDQAPALKEYNNFLDSIGGSYGECIGGSIRSVHARANMNFHANIMVDPEIVFGKYDPEYITEIPFEKFGMHNLDNYKKFESSLKLYEKAKKQLIKAFIDTKGLSPKTAEQYAEKTLAIEGSRGYWEGQYKNYKETRRYKILKNRPLDEIKKAENEMRPDYAGSYFIDQVGDPEPTLMIAVINPKALEFLLNEEKTSALKSVKEGNEICDTEKYDCPEEENMSAGYANTSLNDTGKTALMSAAQYNRLESVKLLLKHGANPNLQLKHPFDIRNNGPTECSTYNISYGKRTALMYAASNASLDVVKALLEGGADKTVPDSKGLRAIHYLLGEGPLPPNKVMTEAEFREAIKLLE